MVWAGVLQRFSVVHWHTKAGICQKGRQFLRYSTKIGLPLIYWGGTFSGTVTVGCRQRYGCESKNSTSGVPELSLNSNSNGTTHSEESLRILYREVVPKYLGLDSTGGRA